MVENTNDYIVGRLANFTNTAEGSVLPPPQRGQFRVPFVSTLKVTNTQSVVNATVFTLTWQDVISNVPASQSQTVDHYNIYYKIPGDGTGQPIGPFTAKNSPAIISIPFTQQAPVTFIVQTVLSNGMVSELGSSPTTTGFTAPYLVGGDSIFVAGMTLTNNSPGAGQIAWSTCQVFYNGNSYLISSGNTSSNLVVWVVGSNTFTTANANQFIPSQTQFIIATNNAGTADIAWNKIGAGGVAGSHMNLPQLLDGPGGQLAIATTWTSNTPAGEITWAAGQATYQGVTYSFPTGHTSSTFVVYWQLANPTVLQSSVGLPASLGPNDFIVAFNSQNSLGASGVYSPGMEIHNANGDRTVFEPDLITMFNFNNQITASMSRAGGANNYGTISVADGTGSGSLGSGKKIIATGNDGKVQMATFDVNVANTPGANVYPNFENMSQGTTPSHTFTGYLIINVNGTTAYLQYYT